MYPLLPDHPPAEELQELVTNLFMSGFVRLGKIFNLNRSFDMWLINKVFQKVGKKDRKQYAQHPACFCNISEPYDAKNHAARYHFTQCPLNTFARREGYEEVLPVMCDIDHLTARLMHFKLHREQTLAGGGSVCDYWFVGDKVKNPR